MAKPMKGVSSRERNGVIYWYARIHGRVKYCGKGSKGRSIAIAAKSKEVSSKYENQEINTGLKVKKAEFKTVKKLIDWYMKQPSVQKLKSYPQKLTRAGHLSDYFGKMPLHNLDSDDQELYREKRLARGIKDGTIDNEIAMLSAVFHLAVRRKKIPADFMPGEFVKVKSKLPRRRITESEYNRLLKHANEDFKDILICGYESAMRRSEIMKLTRDQVHLDMQHISGARLDYIDLGIFDTKTGARRTVPVSPALKSVLERRIRGIGGEDFVFTHEDHKCTKHFIYTSMQDTCEKAKIPYGDNLLNKKGERIGIVFHCLRHTRTSIWVEQGYSDEIVRRASGHRSLAAYQEYIKLDPNVVMRLVENSERYKTGTKMAQSL